MLKKNYKSLFRFCIVGAVNTLLDMGIFIALLYGAGVNVMVSHVIAATFAMGNSYLMNKYWTFGEKTPHNRDQIIRFFLVSLIGLGFGSMAIYVLKAYTTQIIAKIFAIAVTMIWNYAGNRFFVFQPGTRV